MKLLQHLILLSLLAVLSSCSNIVFNDAVPHDKDALDEFPEEIQGVYIDSESDTLEIFTSNFKYGNINGNPLIKGELGDEIILKNFDDYYFLNFKNDKEFWEMIAAKKTKKGLVLMCVDIENKNEIRQINSHIKKGQAKSLKKDGKYLIKPNTHELLKILNDTSVCEETVLIKIKK